MKDSQYAAAVVELVQIGMAKQAVKYVSSRHIVKATLQGKRDGRRHSTTILVTIGTPNYKERNFVRKALQAGEPFPVKKIQLS